MSQRYFIDLDNTLCITKNSDYQHSIPITERIEEVNKLKKIGHYIVIWTARGSISKQDYTELTKKQLKEWEVNYDELLMGKPNYDIYIDDKSYNVDTYWKLPNMSRTNHNGEIKTEKSKIRTSEIVEKGWGKEIIFINNDEYCGKILCFEKNKKCSMHYHLKKKETWYVAKGEMMLSFIDTPTGTLYKEILKVGDVITNERGEPHQLEALEYSEVFEVSTKHFDEDSYRIYKGD